MDIPIDFFAGRWERALAHVTQIDSLIADGPYSKKTHDGHDALRADKERRKLPYKPWTPRQARAFVRAWSPRTRGWFCLLTDHVLMPHILDELEKEGRYAFQPIPCVTIGRSCRVRGDGPSSWADQLCVARPRNAEFAAWGTLPGAYVIPRGERPWHTGGKSLALMRAIVRDYSRPGDLVCDPVAGVGTTLIAAALEHRRAIGAEMNKTTRDSGVTCIRSRWYPLLPLQETTEDVPAQGALSLALDDA